MLRYAILISALTLVGACKTAQQTEEKYELKSPCASAASTGPCAGKASQKDAPLPPKDITKRMLLADMA